MTKMIKGRTFILALIIFVFAVGYTYAANKVVVIPLGADSQPKTGVELTCPASAFYPKNQAEYYGFAQRWGAAGGSTDFACPIMLPVGSTLTGFKGIIRDNDAIRSGLCWLRRTTFSNLYEESLATTNLSNGDSVTPQVLVDNSISSPVIASGYGYYMQCRSYGYSITVVGATVTYDE